MKVMEEVSCQDEKVELKLNRRREEARAPDRGDRSWRSSYAALRGGRGETWTCQGCGQTIFTFKESWWNLATINSDWVLWCLQSTWDHFVRSKSVFSPGRGPCAGRGGVNGEEPQPFQKTTWCNSPTTLPHLCWKILNSRRNIILCH